MLSLNELLQQEKQLRFQSFDEETAWALGSIGMAMAAERRIPVAIRISRHGQILFQAARQGCSRDNDLWLEGKIKVVDHFLHSSFYVSRKLIEEKSTMEEKHLLPSKEYRPKGGAVPLFTHNAGLAGVVAVSGLKDHADHDLAIEMIAAFLGITDISLNSKKL